MSKIKIIHFIYSLGTGGAETLVKDYALLTEKKDCELIVLCIKRRGNSPYEKILEENGIKVIYIQDYTVIKTPRRRLSKLIDYIQSYILVRKVIHKENPDILHTHLCINSFVRFAKPSRSTSIFHTVHNKPKVLWRKTFMRRLDFKSTKWLVRHRGMRLIVLDRAMQEEINAMFKTNNSILLNNGINLSRFRQAKNKNITRKELRIPRDAFTIGHIGRFTTQKNHLFLIEIFKQVLKRNSKSFLLMVGDGPEKKTVEQILKKTKLDKNAMILSNRNDIPDILGAIDVFVFPSLFEGLPVSLIEAQESQTPCFISDNISEYAIISNLVTTISTNEKPSLWAKTILSYKKPNSVIINDAEWDIRKIAKQLKKIYLSSLKGDK